MSRPHRRTTVACPDLSGGATTLEVSTEGHLLTEKITFHLPTLLLVEGVVVRAAEDVAVVER
jgi:hypothetical protein